MVIRKNPIGFSECDTPDEVQKFLNQHLGYFREIEERLSVLEGKTSAKPEKKTLRETILGKGKKGGK